MNIDLVMNCLLLCLLMGMLLWQIQIISIKGRSAYNRLFAVFATVIVVFGLGMNYLSARDERDFLPKCAMGDGDNPSYLREWLDSGSSPDFIDDDGRSLLMIATEEGNGNIVRLLLDYKVNKDYKTSEGWTAASIALQRYKDSTGDKRNRYRRICKLLGVERFL